MWPIEYNKNRKLTFLIWISKLIGEIYSIKNTKRKLNLKKQFCIWDKKYRKSAWPFKNVTVRESLLMRGMKDKNKKP